MGHISIFIKTFNIEHLKPSFQCRYITPFHNNISRPMILAGIQQLTILCFVKYLNTWLTHCTKKRQQVVHSTGQFVVNAMNNCDIFTLYYRGCFSNRTQFQLEYTILQEVISSISPHNYTTSVSQWLQASQEPRGGQRYIVGKNEKRIIFKDLCNTKHIFWQVVSYRPQTHYYLLAI